MMKAPPEAVLTLATQARLRRMARLRDRVSSEVRLRPAPALVCPGCCVQLRFDSSHIGGVRRDEQWDYFTCDSCGQFEYRHRTRKLRRVG